MNFSFALACGPIVIAATASDVQLVDVFDDDVQNCLGGFRNIYARSPSSASAMRVAGAGRGGVGRAVRIQAIKQSDGFCGFWIHFFNMRADRPDYFDSRRFSHLSFWVRGQEGGEQFAVRIADARWIEKEDSHFLGDVSRFLPAGVTDQWQEVLVPLPSAEQIDRRRLGGLTLDFPQPGRFVIYVDDVSFKVGPQAPVPISLPEEPEIVFHAPAHPRSLWIWSPQPLLTDDAETTELFRLCKQGHIGRLWVQLLYSVQQDRPNEAGCRIRDPDRWRQFLRRAHEAQIQVHALDGDPEFCAVQKHPIPLAVVDAVIQFNRRSSLQERLDGIHFDNEPYLLVGWQDLTCREQILRDYLRLHAECQRRVDQEPGLTFGVDIPFWWQEKDGRGGEPPGMVTFNGKRKPASYHLIDLLDQVGIMNYRDQADGADGMIAHGRDLLRYGDSTGRARIVMGVETYGQSPQEICFALGIPQDRFGAVLKDQGRAYAARSRVRGFRLRAYHDTQNVHIGMEVPAGTTLAKSPALLDAWLQVAGIFGADSHELMPETQDRILTQAREEFGRDVEWDRFSVGKVIDPGSGRMYTAFSARSHMLPKITFADDSVEDLHVQTSAAEDYFQRYGSYDGLAIHYLKSYRQLLHRPGQR